MAELQDFATNATLRAINGISEKVKWAPKFRIIESKTMNRLHNFFSSSFVDSIQFQDSKGKSVCNCFLFSFLSIICSKHKTFCPLSQPWKPSETMSVFFLFFFCVLRCYRYCHRHCRYHNMFELLLWVTVYISSLIFSCL